MRVTTYRPKKDKFQDHYLKRPSIPHFIARKAKGFERPHKKNKTGIYPVCFTDTEPSIVVMVDISKKRKRFIVSGDRGEEVKSRMKSLGLNVL